MAQVQIDIVKLMESAGGYAPQSFQFIRDGLARTAETVHGQAVEAILTELGIADDTRHVSGTELCIGLRDFAIDRYGLMAMTVLGKWGITETRDFGNIIFALVNADLMRATEDDHIDDFDGVYDFDDAFADPDLTSIH
ncbi:MAG: hypothetical protein JKY96_06375 [Phycisphaerales bacterium]|nr:hypothetical protein [Phycisphaerales bacterium]